MESSTASYMHIRRAEIMKDNKHLTPNHSKCIDCEETTESFRFTPTDTATILIVAVIIFTGLTLNIMLLSAIW